MSKREANRYLVLKDKLDHNEIQDLQLQVKYELIPKYTINNKNIREISYIADFVYMEDNKQVVEDCKGFKTDIYKLKKKMFEYKYNIEIRET